MFCRNQFSYLQSLQTTGLDYFKVNIGSITNSVFNDNSFGNIVDNSLKSIIEMERFKEYWSITKDKIDVCNQCEYRNMCIDNRVPVKRDNGSYYFEGEFDYNPFISKWKEEQQYVNLVNCGVVIDKNQIHIDKRKIEGINLEIWSV